MVHHVGDKTVITHVEDLEPLFSEVAQTRKSKNNGFSKGRTMRYLGSVPLMTLIRNPHLADPKELKKYLRKHPRCRAVPANTF
jgi:hypothetical protein